MVTESIGVVLYYIYLEVIAIRWFAVSTKNADKIFFGLFYCLSSVARQKIKKNITLVHKRKGQKRQNLEY